MPDYLPAPHHVIRQPRSLAIGHKPVGTPGSPVTTVIGLIFRSFTTRREKCEATAELFAQAAAMHLTLALLRLGLARIEVETREFCFRGLRYSFRDGDYNTLINVIGWAKAETAVREVEPNW